MSKKITITALGLIITAGLLKVGAIPFTKWASANYEFFAFQFAIKELNPVMHEVVNMSAIFPAIYIAVCLGCGFLLACLVSSCFQKLSTVFSKRLQHHKCVFKSEPLLASGLETNKCSNS